LSLEASIPAERPTHAWSGLILGSPLFVSGQLSFLW
jgi:hypothetical protein